MSVQAKDKASGKEQQIRIMSSGGLSEADIKAMVREAEVNAGSDKKRRAFVEARNQADALVGQVQSALAEHGSKVPAAVKTDADDAVTAARSAMSGNDHAALLVVIEHLKAASMKLAEAGQASQQGASPSGDHPESAHGPDGKVVDAEFEEVGERKSAA